MQQSVRPSALDKPYQGSLINEGVLMGLQREQDGVAGGLISSGFAGWEKYEAGSTAKYISDSRESHLGTQKSSFEGIEGFFGETWGHKM